MTNKKRVFTRVPCQIQAAIEGLGEVMEGEVSDLSLKGLFVKTQGSTSLGDEVDVTLRMPMTNPPLEFRVHAEVVRIAQDGIGLKICESDIQAFTHLRNIVAMQADEPDEILDELFLVDKKI